MNRSRLPIGENRQVGHWNTMNCREGFSSHTSISILPNYDAQLRGIEFISRNGTDALARNNPPEAYALDRSVMSEKGPHFEIKRRAFLRAALSLHGYHHHSELRVQNTAQVAPSGVPQLLTDNETSFIFAGHQQRLDNPGVIGLVVKSGEYPKANNIVRFDQCGRNR